MTALIAANPLSGPFQTLLKALGAVLAWLYSLIPNYGIAIILFTLAIRVVLLPLGMKQIRSMQSLQVLQPKVKALQLKHKGDRQRVQEETMKLYKEHGVNPLGGCLPLLAQFPILIALFAVLRVPQGLPHVQGSAERPTRLYRDIQSQASGIHFLGANLICSAAEAGHQVTVPKSADSPEFTKKCGAGGPIRIPYYVFLALMIGTTFYQQRQMQRASPGPQNPQQQLLTRVMPLFFGFIGFTFPSGLVIYWTTTNLVQIGQQYFLLSKRKAPAEEDEKAASGDGRRGGSGSVRRNRGARPSGGGKEAERPRGLEGLRGRRSGSGGDGKSDGTSRRGGSKGGRTQPQGGTGGGRSGGNRKKRRKR